MRTATQSPILDLENAKARPTYIYHSSFEEPGAEKSYGSVPANDETESTVFMSDDVTREFTKRMHYAGWRVNIAAKRKEVILWTQRYLDCRNRIVLGNRKLTFKAVQKWRPAQQFADDMAAECQIVLIKAVSAFSPWLGIRFSTYAFTCLMRALSRLSQRYAADRLSHATTLESLPFGEPFYVGQEESSSPRMATIGKYLREEDTLLSQREKLVLLRRYHPHDNRAKLETLEKVGQDLGLSKERVRQVQMSALEKLRNALSAERSCIE